MFHAFCRVIGKQHAALVQSISLDLGDLAIPYSRGAFLRPKHGYRATSDTTFRDSVEQLRRFAIKKPHVSLSLIGRFVGASPGMRTEVVTSFDVKIDTGRGFKESCDRVVRQMGSIFPRGDYDAGEVENEIQHCKVKDISQELIVCKQ